MDICNTYRPWESRWSPHNRAVREAHAAERHDQRLDRRRRFAAELDAAQPPREDTSVRRHAAEAQAMAASVVMKAPQRCCVVTPNRCAVPA